MLLAFPAMASDGRGADNTAFPLEEQSMNRVVINADLGQQKISRHLYGHFAQHLGRCIYEGL